MRLRNTSSYAKDEILEAIRFAKPAAVSNFDIWVKAGLQWRGVAYSQGHYDRSTKGNFSNRGRTARKQQYTAHTPYVIIVATGRPTMQGISHLSWPAGRKGRGYLRVVTYTRMETLLYLLAHELRHLWQAKVKKGWRIWGARGQYSERDCDAYAVRRLRHWRRAGSPFYGAEGELL